MSSLLEHTDQLERELAPEPVKGPAMGSIVLHTALFATLLLWGAMQGWFHHNLWGASGGSGAIQVNLVSNALPLPSKQPVNQNVLSTETPSQAPTQPEQKTKQAVDDDAIALQGKQKKPEKQTQTRSVVKPSDPVQPNRAQYGEQAGTNVQRTMQNYSVGQTSVSDASFGSLFGWYVQQIDRKMNQSGNRNMADQRTPKGAKAGIERTHGRLDPCTTSLGATRSISPASGSMPAAAAFCSSRRMACRPSGRASRVSPFTYMSM